MNNIIEQVISGLLVLFIGSITKLLISACKTANPKQKTVQKFTKPKVLKTQFFVNLFLLPSASITAALVTNSILKFFLFSVAAFALLVVWGVFDEIFPYYPQNLQKDSRVSNNSENSTDENT